MESGSYVTTLPVFKKDCGALQVIARIEPQKIGGYTQDSSGDYHDGENVRCIVALSCESLDLNSGFDGYVDTFIQTMIYMDDMLRWIMKHKAEIGSLRGKFVSRRSAIYTLLAAPYETRDDWIVDVTLYKGTYYMCFVATEAMNQRREEDEKDEKKKKRNYWGLKFEHYLTADSPESEPDIAREVNSSEGSYLVMQAKIQDHQLVYACEVDGYDASKPSDIIELKTIKRHQMEQNYFKSKQMNWYLKAKLSKVSKVKAGIVDDNGMVDASTMIDFSLDEMEQDCKYFWRPEACYHNANELLRQIKLYVDRNKDNPCIVYRFAYDAQTRFITVTERGPSSDVAILPKWYTGADGRTGTEQDPQAESHND